MGKETRWQRTRRDTSLSFKREAGVAVITAGLAWWLLPEQQAMEEVVAIGLAVLAVVVILPCLEFAWNLLRAPLRIARDTIADLEFQNADLQSQLDAYKGAYEQEHNFKDEYAAPLLQSDAKNDTTVEFTNLDQFEREDFRIIVDDFVPESNGVGLCLHVGDDGGFWSAGYSNFPLNQAEKEDTEIIVAENLASNAQRPGRIEITLYRPFTSGTEKRISFESYAYTIMNMYSKYESTGIFKYSLEPITQVRIFTSSGKILSGNFKLYGRGGLRNSTR